MLSVSERKRSMDFDLEERDGLWFRRVRGSREETSGKEPVVEEEEEA